MAGSKVDQVNRTSLPMLTLYPFVQHYFIRGIMLGSVNG